MRIRMTTAEKQRIKENAIKAHYKNNASAYVRQQALKGKVMDYQYLKELTIQINRIGNNINQIAKIMNTYYDFTDTDYNAAYKEVLELKKLMEDFIK